MGQHGQYRTLVGAALAGAAALAATPALACRLALLLALDVSSSVDAGEDKLQREGLAAALRSPEVVAAFLSGGQPVTLAAFEWSGTRHQHVFLDWIVISSSADLARAAARVETSGRLRDDLPTSMGTALGFASTMLQRAPDCLQRTIDVSGDGENNDGYPPRIAYKHFPLGDVHVNGLVVGGPPELKQWFVDEVLRGPGAFVETARDYADFERAMRRKLEREVASRPLGMLR